MIMVKRRPVCTRASGSSDRHDSVRGHLSPVLHGRGISVCTYKRVRGFRRLHIPNDSVSCIMGSTNSLDHGMGPIRNALFYDPRPNFSVFATSGGRLSVRVVSGGKGMVCAMGHAG